MAKRKSVDALPLNELGGANPFESGELAAEPIALPPEAAFDEAHEAHKEAAKAPAARGPPRVAKNRSFVLETADLPPANPFESGEVDAQPPKPLERELSELSKAPRALSNPKSSLAKRRSIELELAANLTEANPFSTGELESEPPVPLERALDSLVPSPPASGPSA